jgi:uncharacterized protein
VNDFLLPAYPRHRVVLDLVIPKIPAGEMAHDEQHLARVYAWCVRLAREHHVDVDVAGAMGLVHDVAFIPKDSVDRALGGERSALLAGDLLAQAGYDAAAIKEIAEAVRTSSWSRGLAATSTLGKILQDADRLDAIGAHGLMRMFACGQFMSRAENPGTFYFPRDPCATSSRPLNDRRYALDHCYVKLLRLAEGMHFPSAQAEAARRHQAMRTFLAAVQAEWASTNEA